MANLDQRHVRYVDVVLERAGRKLRHAAHVYHTTKDEEAKVSARAALEQAARDFVMAELNAAQDGAA